MNPHEPSRPQSRLEDAAAHRGAPASPEPLAASPWRTARRAAAMAPSVLRELLKVVDRPGVLSLAGGLPRPEGFPVEALRAACDAVLREAPHAALQYAPSEGHAPLRAWVAERLAAAGLAATPEQVLITHGSQQGLDLVAKVLVDEGAPVAVPSPAYLGALQAFQVMQPHFVGLAGDAQGPLPQALAEAPQDTRFVYLQPNFQNPSGALMPAARRQALVAAARARGLPIVEDDPYGELWFDAPPPAPLAAHWPEGVVYLGSLSKVLAPGLRLGFLVAPPALFPKLLQAKQAADLHTSGFSQRVVAKVLAEGLLAQQLPALRLAYAAQARALDAALHRHLPDGCDWQRPQGGMFFWLRLPPGLSATALLPAAVAAGVAYVPGAPFFVKAPDDRHLRLSLATLSPQDLDEAARRLGQVLRQAQPAGGVGAVPPACTTPLGVSCMTPDGAPRMTPDGVSA